MRESKAEPIKRIVKLVDVVNRCSQVLIAAYEARAESAFQQFVQKMQKKMEQFGFELQTELGRLGGEEAPASAQELNTNPKTALEGVLDHYGQALSTSLPAHARAMLTRQSVEMQKAYEEFISLDRAA